VAPTTYYVAHANGLDEVLTESEADAYGEIDSIVTIALLNGEIHQFRGTQGIEVNCKLHDGLADVTWSYNIRTYGPSAWAYAERPKPDRSRGGAVSM
jgi:hypothetical protein